LSIARTNCNRFEYFLNLSLAVIQLSVAHEDNPHDFVFTRLNLQIIHGIGNTSVQKSHHCSWTWRSAKIRQFYIFYWHISTNRRTYILAMS